MEETTGAPTSDAMNDTARPVLDSASSIASSAKEAMSQQAEASAQRMAGSARDLASALRSAADGVPQENGWVGNLLSKSADGIERATASLSSGDFSGMLQEVNGFARRQPAIFLGACIALGFAAARIGKTAVEQSAAPETMES